MLNSKYPSDEIAQAADCLTRARLKLQGERRGPYRNVVIRASRSLEKMIVSLQNMGQDLKHLGL